MTENLYHTAVQNAVSNRIASDNIDDIVGQIRAQGLTIANLNFAIVDNRIVISQIAGPQSTTIKGILAPLVSRDIDAKGIETARKLQYEQLAEMCGSYNITFSAYDKLVDAFLSNSSTQIIWSLESMNVTLTQNDPRVVYDRNGDAKFVSNIASPQGTFDTSFRMFRFQ